MVSVATFLVLSLLAVTLLARLPVVTSQAAVTCTTVTHSMDLRTCFKIQDISDVQVHGMGSIANTSIHVEGFLTEPAVFCREKEKYVNLLDCLSGATSKCFPPEMAEYVPNTDVTSDGMDFLCQHINSSETLMDCYMKTYSKVFECAHRLADEQISAESSADFAAVVCKAADITHDCIEVKVNCDDKARDTLLEFHDKYRTPPGCPAPGREREKYITTNGGVFWFTSSSCLIFTLLVSATFV